LPRSSQSTAGSTRNDNGSDFSSRLRKIQETQPELLKAVAQVVRERYKGTLPKATNTTNKLAYRFSLDELKRSEEIHNLLSGYVSEVTPSGLPVLLYELTTQYKTFEIKCEQNCLLSIDHKPTHI
jgi:hypothetical protein